jgi:hypothetical protein
MILKYLPRLMRNENNTIVLYENDLNQIDIYIYIERERGGGGGEALM